jgi:hypothetical protein
MGKLFSRVIISLYGLIITVVVLFSSEFGLNYLQVRALNQTQSVLPTSGKWEYSIIGTNPTFEGTCEELIEGVVFDAVSNIEITLITEDEGNSISIDAFSSTGGGIAFSGSYLLTTPGVYEKQGTDTTYILQVVSSEFIEGSTVSRNGREVGVNVEGCTLTLPVQISLLEAFDTSTSEEMASDITLLTPANVSDIEVFRTLTVYERIRVLKPVRIRNQPGIDGGENSVLGSASFGDELILRPNTELVQADGYTWLPITFGGQDAWVSQEGFVEIVASGKQELVSQDAILNVLSASLPVGAIGVVVLDYSLQAIDETGAILATWYWLNDENGEWGLERHLTEIERLNAEQRVADFPPPFPYVSDIYNTYGYESLRLSNFILTDFRVVINNEEKLAVLDFLYNTSIGIRQVRFSGVAIYSGDVDDIPSLINFDDYSNFPIGESLELSLAFPTSYADTNLICWDDTASEDWKAACDNYVKRIAASRTMNLASLETSLYGDQNFIDLTDQVILLEVRLP